jgi:hypothetical protein
MLSDFNVPNYDWINGTPLPNCYYYNKIHMAICFRRLDQRNNSQTVHYSS